MTGLQRNAGTAIIPMAPPTTELQFVRQVSWLAGQSHLARLPGIAASDIVGDRLTAYSCGTAPGFHRIPLSFHRVAEEP